MSTKNRDLSIKHKAAFRQRRKNGLQSFDKPWGWLTLAEVQKLAVEAYRSASFAISNPDDQTEHPRDFFADDLIQAFECLVDGLADGVGIARGPSAKHYAACLRERVPADWRPQYPVYQKKAPASAINTPEAMINADEGNANEHDSRL